MKRWLAAAMLASSALLLLMPLYLATQPGPPQRAPEVREPMVPFVSMATGERREIPMEEYLLGVVAAEMNEDFPVQALAAQAILARTYTLSQLRRGVTATDDVRLFQAYDPDRITEKVRQAMVPTRGLVVVYGDELIHAVYHACAGGRTAGAPEGMQAEDLPYLRPVEDPPCRQTETWSVRFSPEAVGAAAGLGEPAWDVALGQRGPTGRALTVVVNGHEVNAWAFRHRLGGVRMKSTYLTEMRLEEGRVVISGRGFGHGVGLSQWGAAALAERGLSAEEIIRHYYTGVRVTRLW